MYKKSMEVFIHCYCKNDYGKILIQKFKRIRMSGLLDAVDKITITVSNFRASDNIFFEEYKKLSPKIHVHILEEITIGDECDTFNYLKKYVENFEHNKQIFYSHTKGVSQLNPYVRKNIDQWSKFMDYWCIYSWERCIAELKNHDTAGTLYYNDGKSNHYSGNFWWVNSDYLKSLPYITKELHQKINRGEYWISLNEKHKGVWIDRKNVEPETFKIYREKNSELCNPYLSLIVDDSYFPIGF